MELEKEGQTTLELYRPPGCDFDLCVTCDISPSDMRNLEVEIRNALPPPMHPEDEWMLIWDEFIPPYIYRKDENRWTYFFKSLNPKNVEEYNCRKIKTHYTPNQSWLFPFSISVVSVSLLLSVIALVIRLLQ